MAHKAKIKYKMSKYIFTQEDFELLSAFGVYKIFHLDNPKLFYIGSTASKERQPNWAYGFYTRFLTHLNQLKRGDHRCKAMQKFINEHGLDGLRFTILKTCNAGEQLIIEQQFLKELKPKWNTWLDYIPIYQFSKTGILVKAFKSMEEASDITKIDRASINNSALGNRPSAGGFLWSYDSSIKVKARRVILQLCESGGIIKAYSTLEDAAKAMNTCSSTSIRGAIAGTQKQAYGYKWAAKKLSAQERNELGLTV